MHSSRIFEISKQRLLLANEPVSELFGKTTALAVFTSVDFGGSNGKERGKAGTGAGKSEPLRRRCRIPAQRPGPRPEPERKSEPAKGRPAGGIGRNVFKRYW